MPVISRHLYIDPETFEVYAEPGDVLSAQVVEALDHIGAKRIEPEREDRSSDYCPKCGCHFATHNGDGSCVVDD